MLEGEYLDSLNQLLKMYDATLEDNLTMYDKLPYNRDYDICGPGKIGLISGNLVKYYRCAPSESVMVENHDSDFMRRLSEERHRAEKRQEALSKPKEEIPSELSEEQIQSLLGDLDIPTDALESMNE